MIEPSSHTTRIEAVPSSPRGEGPAGRLLAIGGREDRTGEKRVLREILRRLGPGQLAIVTAASEEPERYFELYQQAFRELGFRDLVHLPVRTRRDASCPERVRLLSESAGVFFTGGDQSRITRRLRNTPLGRRVRELYYRGGLVAGTSAGAAAMSDVMLAGGGDASGSSDILIGQGLGLLPEAIIDQHFTQRRRMGRLLEAVARHRHALGVGIDEDTAILVERGNRFSVVGQGFVYVVDGCGVGGSPPAATAAPTRTLQHARLHVLSQGDSFDVRTRRPGTGSRGTQVSLRGVPTSAAIQPWLGSGADGAVPAAAAAPAEPSF